MRGNFRATPSIVSATISESDLPNSDVTGPNKNVVGLSWCQAKKGRKECRKINTAMVPEKRYSLYSYSVMSTCASYSRISASLALTTNFAQLTSDFHDNRPTQIVGQIGARDRKLFCTPDYSTIISSKSPKLRGDIDICMCT